MFDVDVRACQGPLKIDTHDETEIHPTPAKMTHDVKQDAGFTTATALV